MRFRVTGLVLSLALLVIVLVGSCANVMPVNTKVDSTLSTTQSIFGSTTTVTTIQINEDAGPITTTIATDPGWTHPPMVFPTDYTFTPTPPIPDSEMTTIVFSLEWLRKNDQWPDSSGFKVTFPTSWLTNAPPVPEGETPITLWVPTKLLMDNDENPDPNFITAALFDLFFKGLPS